MADGRRARRDRPGEVVAAVIDPAPAAIGDLPHRREIAVVLAVGLTQGPVLTAVRPSQEMKLCVGHQRTDAGGFLRPLRKSRAHTAWGLNITASVSA